MSTFRLLPRRWPGPRGAASRQDDLPVTPGRDDWDGFFQSMLNGMVTPWEAMNDFLPFWRRQKIQADILPSLDLTSDENAYALSMELPGVEPENVKVEVRDNALVVAGEKKQESSGDQKNQHVLERAYGSFQRVLALPEDADTDAITASCKNGVLHIAIPRKATSETQTKSIEIVKE